MGYCVSLLFGSVPCDFTVRNPDDPLGLSIYIGVGRNAFCTLQPLACAPLAGYFRRVWNIGDYVCRWLCIGW